MTARRLAPWAVGLAVVLSACVCLSLIAVFGLAGLSASPRAAHATPEPITAATELPPPAAIPTSAATGAPAATPAPTASQAPAVTAPPPAITEQRFVEIEWPVAVRVGDSDFIRLSLVPGEAGSLVPTAESEGHETAGEPIEIPNVYDTHNVLAVAELSGVGFEIDRPGEISQSLLPGERARWQWTIAPTSAGKHVLTLTLKLRFVPKSGGESTERPAWARTLTVEGKTVLGLSGRAADFLGVLGTLSGSVLGFPFADRAYGWVWRRLFPKRKMD